MENLTPIGASKKIVSSQSIMSVFGNFDGTFPSSIFQLSSEKYNVLSAITINLVSAIDASSIMSPKLTENQYKE
jgi:hypothetical protein